MNNSKKLILIYISIGFIVSFLFLIVSCKQNEIHTIDEQSKIKLDSLKTSFDRYLKINIDSAQNIVLRFKEIAYKTGNHDLIAESNLLLAIFYHEKGKMNDAAHYFDLSYNQLQNSTDTLLQITFLNKYGLFLNDNSTPDSAIIIYNKGLELSKQIKDTTYELMITTNMGVVYQNQRKTDLAIKTFINSLQLLEKMHDSVNYAQTSRNIAIVLQEVGEFESALTYFRKSLLINQALGFENEVGSEYMNIGILYRSLNTDSSKLYYKKAADIFRKTANDFELMKVNYNQANLLKEEGKYREAEKIYLDVLKNSKANNSTFGIFASMHQLGIIEIKLGNIISSGRYFDSSIAVATQNNFTSNLLISTKEAFELHLEKKNLDKAIEYYNLWKNLDDSTHIQEMNNAVLKYKTLYESEKNERENQILRNDKEKQNLTIQKANQLRSYLLAILLLFVLLIILLYSKFIFKKKANEELKEKNKLIQLKSIQLTDALEKLTFLNENLNKQKIEIQQQADLLKEANATKNKFFSIIAHDLKNPFNVILGYLDILNNDYEEISDETRKSFIDILYKASSSTYNLLENLLTWSFTQQGKIEIKKEKIALKQLIDKGIAPYLSFAEKKNQQLTNNVDENIEVYLDIETLATVIGNCVNNAIKFSHEGGIIEVNALRTDSTIEIRIKDNGIGIDSSLIPNLFMIDKSNSTEGTANERGSGLGLILCKEFVELNDGKIIIESEKQKGTTVIISIPSNLLV
jgi:signal transduction histidine kinase/tetratricopeptide (TPR) repeat protein